ncbi:DUF6950 family protein [Paracoccus sp. (in: a-proteobacteria)]|uniref:DUF6950 family protein n=1 Tax=Paracoccus sp. TaxID=267 RepID=UPI00289AF2C4|nr:hypothetical protein [Paracoccus sp. (in: a-proteobacteria)]
MISPLYAELNRWRITPWEWGRMDCVLSLADWCLAQGWPDPMADVRMTYHDRSSCQRETGFLREPLGITSRCFEGVAGLSVVARAAPGDIAILSFGQYEHFGAVWAGSHGWASKDEGGVTFYDPRLVPAVLRIWGVGYAP